MTTIGIDWGTSNLRAYRFGEDGAVTDTRASTAGMASVPAGGFEAVLAELIGDWCGAGGGGGDVLLVMAGMVGSRTGWAEAPYLPCPAPLDAIAGAAIAVPTRLGRAWILPGMSDLVGGADVMRGEETQFWGMAEEGAALLVAPGTHSKWAPFDGRAITGIKSFMTGELFAVLSQHSLLGRSMAPGDDPAAFRAGVAQGFAGPSLSTGLFGVRAGTLLGTLAATGARDYLSGLLIGDEVAAGLALFGRDRPIRIVANGGLIDRYAVALDLAGQTAVSHVDGGEAVTRGLWRAAQALKEKHA